MEIEDIKKTQDLFNKFKIDLIVWKSYNYVLLMIS